MKKVLALYGVLFTLTGFCQLKTAVLGVSYPTDKRENFSGFIGETTTSVFTADYLYISRKKQELTVRQFHKSDLQLVNSVNIYENVLEDFYSEPMDLYFQNGKFFLYSTYFGEKEKINLLTLEIFNETLEKESFKIVDTLELEETVEIAESQEMNGFAVVRYNKFSTLTEQEITILRLDNQGETLWKDVVRSPLALQNLNVESVCFSQRTPIYLICNYSFEPKTGVLGDENELISNKYALWAYDHKKNYLKETEIRIRAKFINGLRMDLSPNNELIISGYFNATREYSVQGVFSMRMRQFKVISSSFQAFDEATMARFIDEKDREKYKELPDYRLDNLILLDNGSWYITGEQFYKYIERSYDPRTNITTTTEHYNYNRIIVSYFDSLGNYKWTECVPKFQNSTNDFGYYASYCFLNTGKALYLFFNDSEKNKDLALDDYFNYKGLFNNRRFLIAAVKLGTKGIEDRSVLVDENNSFMLRSKVCQQINNHTMYLLGESGRTSRIMAVSVE